MEYRNFKEFNAESFLNDLYILPWSELDNNKMSMRCGNAGNPYLSKYWTNLPHLKQRE
jgi:hypothetical protein